MGILRTIRPMHRCISRQSIPQNRIRSETLLRKTLIVLLGHKNNILM